MDLKCLICGAAISCIIPEEWPYQNIFPVNCTSCHKQQLITIKD